MDRFTMLFIALAAICYTLSTTQGQGMSGSQVRPPRHCGPVCKIFCEFGNVPDSRGCPTCHCNPNPFPPPPRTSCPPGSVATRPRRGCSGFTLRGNSQRCPRGSFCVPDPADGPGVCCRRRFTPPVTFPPPPRTSCPSGSAPTRPRRGCSGFTFPGHAQRCPRGSFCVPDPADGPGVCCRRRFTPPGFCRPVNRRIRCVRHWDQCNTDSDCGQGRCCPGSCGRECQRGNRSGYGRRD